MKCDEIGRRGGCPRCPRTLYFARSSLERGEDMILRRMDEGAVKCALRDLRREEEASVKW